MNKNMNIEFTADELTEVAERFFIQMEILFEKEYGPVDDSTKTILERFLKHGAFANFPHAIDTLVKNGINGYSIMELYRYCQDTFGALDNYLPAIDELFKLHGKEALSMVGVENYDGRLGETAPMEAGCDMTERVEDALWEISERERHSFDMYGNLIK